MHYILKIGATYKENGENKIFSSLDGERANSDGSGHLFPRQLSDNIIVEHLEDIHGWIGTKPFDFFGYPVSSRMKKLLEKFNLHQMSFLKTKVIFKDVEYDYYGWNLGSGNFEQFIDFKNSTFCEWKFEKKFSIENLKTTSLKALKLIKREKDWRGWGFDRAVMKHEFKEIDCVDMPYPYGILISERLKNALEEVELTGFEITPFPVEFEYL